MYIALGWRHFRGGVWPRRVRIGPRWRHAERLRNQERALNSAQGHQRQFLVWRWESSSVAIWQALRYFFVCSRARHAVRASRHPARPHGDPLQRSWTVGNNLAANLIHKRSERRRGHLSGPLRAREDALLGSAAWDRNHGSTERSSGASWPRRVIQAGQDCRSYSRCTCTPRP